MMCNYLATINNLDAPITKTADKTMKITYIYRNNKYFWNQAVIHYG